MTKINESSYTYKTRKHRWDIEKMYTVGDEGT